MKKISIVLAVFLVCVMLLPLGISADNPRIIDLSKECDLTVTLRNESKKFENVEISLYLVAKYTADAELAVDDVFSSYPIDFSKMQTNEDYDNLSATLLGYVNSDKIAPTYSAKTNTDGSYKFSNLKCGFYLVSAASYEIETGTYSFKPFMVSAPGLEEQIWEYSVEAMPKNEFTEKEKTKFDVSVLWEDNGDKSKRPEYVTVEIYKDGTLYKEVKIDSNNPTFSWEEINLGSQWTFVEKGVPSCYTISQYQQSFSYKIVNTLIPEEKPAPVSPKTGDYFNIYVYTAIASFVGITLIVISLCARKKKNEEEK